MAVYFCRDGGRLVVAEEPGAGPGAGLAGLDGNWLWMVLWPEAASLRLPAG